MAWELMPAFLAAAFLFGYFPGPALLFVAAQTLGRGRGAGYFAAFGIHVGGYVHVLAATFGLSALLAHTPEIYTALKFAGAAYMVWLGGKMLLARPETRDPTTTQTPRVREKSRLRAFGQSFMVEVLNPKAAIFFIAFLPQFVSEAAILPVWAQLLLLGTVVNVIFTSADVAAVTFTDRAVRAVKATSAGARVARGAAGTALVGLGAHLALQRAP